MMGLLGPLLLLGFVFLTPLFARLSNRPTKEIWKIPEVLLDERFADDKAWLLRHLELGGWKPPSLSDHIVPGSEGLHPAPQSGSIAIGRGATAALPATPLFRVEPGSLCRARPLAVHDEFCSYGECKPSATVMVSTPRTVYDREMERQHRLLMKVLSTPPARTGRPVHAIRDLSCLHCAMSIQHHRRYEPCPVLPPALVELLG